MAQSGLFACDAVQVAALRAVLPEAAFRADPAPYLSEPRGRWKGQGVVVAPADTDELSRTVRFCAERRIGIVPYAGGTSLVGGQIMSEGPAPLILSVERMNRLRAVYRAENVLVAEAGMVLSDVQEAARGVGRQFALSLASEGTARIGGLLGTNAGGVNVLRYGNARAQVLGLEAVLADGSVWNGLTRLRKDNTGYDLRDLLIGSEGTLGIITAAALKLVAQPASVGVALLSIASPGAALDLLALAGDRFGDQITAFELINRQGVDFMTENEIPFRMPLTELPEWMVLIELGLSGGGDADTALEDLFGAAVERGLSDDGVIAQSEAQRLALWHLRETIPEGNRKVGAIASHDISLPLSLIPAFINEARNRLAKKGDFRINCFGHLGDGNLHFNVFPAIGRVRQDYPDKEGVSRIVHDLVHENGGSISAEHGIGRLKTGDLERYGDPAKLAMMRAIKRALDPLGILNPGAVLAAGG